MAEEERYVDCYIKTINGYKNTRLILEYASDLKTLKHIIVKTDGRITPDQITDMLIERFININYVRYHGYTDNDERYQEMFNYLMEHINASKAVPNFKDTSVKTRTKIRNYVITVLRSYHPGDNEINKMISSVTRKMS